MRVPRIAAPACALMVALALAAPAAAVEPSISPATVEATIYPGGELVVDKTVQTPRIPPKVDVCLLEDETASFGDDIGNLKNPATIAAIFNGVRATSPDSEFAVAGFRDYPVIPYGNSGDWVYRLLSTMSPVFANWSAGINALSAGGGGDIPEGQYDAIVAAVNGGLGFASCGFRADPQVARVLVAVTDAPFHIPDGTHVNSGATTIAALNAAHVTVIGLKAPGAGGELDALAAATGGSVQPLSSDGADIAAAILAGLGNLPVEVALASTCSDPISTSFSPASQTVTSGGTASFTETISVASGAAAGTYTCTDNVSFDGTLAEGVVESKTIHVPGISLTPVTDTNELGVDLSHTVTATVVAGAAGPLAGASVEIEITTGPNAGLSATGLTDPNGELSLTWTPAVEPASLGTDSVTAWLLDPAGDRVASADASKAWVDTIAPSAACVATVNPHGKNVPKAPGNGGQGQNQDGFYQLLGTDGVWLADGLELFITDNGSGTVFGPFAYGTRIKYTQAVTGTPVIKKMGSASDAVDWHIIGTGDAELSVVDGSGNTGTASCLVPPPPK